MRRKQGRACCTKCSDLREGILLAVVDCTKIKIICSHRAVGIHSTARPPKRELLGLSQRTSRGSEKCRLFLRILQAGPFERRELLAGLRCRLLLFLAFFFSRGRGSFFGWRRFAAGILHAGHLEW